MGETIVQKNVDELNPHPKNIDFFDNMDEEVFKKFKESVSSSGILNPIIVSQDNKIINGVQRWRACRELGIEKIPCIIKEYPNEDTEIRDIIELNIEQRAKTIIDPMKFARFSDTLERIYHVTKHGGDRKSKRKKSGKESSETKSNLILTQKELAKKFKMSQQYYNRIKRLNNLLPELQERVGLDKGNLKVFKAALITALTKEQQQKLLVMYDGKIDGVILEKVTALKDKIKEVN